MVAACRRRQAFVGVRIYDSRAHERWLTVASTTRCVAHAAAEGWPRIDSRVKAEGTLRMPEIDARGRTIRLTDERLQHLEADHPEMEGQIDRVRETLSQPDRIVVSRSDPKAELYYRRYEQAPVTTTFMCVVVKDSEENGVVITALPPLHEPEPDAAIVRGSIDDYLDHPPGPDDVLCVIEVADSSLSIDLGSKLAAYAEAGIPQYLVVDLAHNLVLTHEQPAGHSYSRVVTSTRGESVHVSAGAGHVSMAVDRLLP